MEHQSQTRNSLARWGGKELVRKELVGPISVSSDGPTLLYWYLTLDRNKFPSSRDLHEATSPEDKVLARILARLERLLWSGKDPHPKPFWTHLEAKDPNTSRNESKINNFGLSGHGHFWEFSPLAPTCGQTQLQGRGFAPKLCPEV